MDHHANASSARQPRANTEASGIQWPSPGYRPHLLSFSSQHAFSVLRRCLSVVRAWLRSCCVTRPLVPLRRSSLVPSSASLSTRRLRPFPCSLQRRNATAVQPPATRATISGIPQRAVVSACAILGSLSRATVRVLDRLRFGSVTDTNRSFFKTIVFFVTSRLQAQGSAMVLHSVGWYKRRRCQSLHAVAFHQVPPLP